MILSYPGSLSELAVLGVSLGDIPAHEFLKREMP